MEGYMNNLLLANISNATAWGTILVIVLVIFLVIFFAIIAKFFKTWLRARLAKAPVSMSNMLGMWLRKVPYPLVVDTRITAAKAGLDISTDELEAHFLAGGDIVDCVLALIAAEKAGIPLSYDREENGGKDEKTAEEELLDLIGVLFYNEMFRRRSRRKHYYNLWL